jgi:hypothetical protein
VTDQDRNKAWGFALFGDDVRAEVGGKLSFMGMYQADMFFPANMPLPIMLPKMVVMILYYEVQGSIEEDIVFRITYGEENGVVGEFSALRKEILEQQAQAQPQNVEIPDEDSERIFSIRLPVTLMPFRMDKMGRLRVRAHFSDGKILKLGSIQMKQVPEAEFQKMIGLMPAS